MKKANLLSRSQRFSLAKLPAFNSISPTKAKESPDKREKASSPTDPKNALQLVSGDDMIALNFDSWPERDEWLNDLTIVMEEIFKKRVFGVALEEFFEREQVTTEGVPLFLKNACESFTEKGIKIII